MINEHLPRPAKGAEMNEDTGWATLVDEIQQDVAKLISAVPESGPWASNILRLSIQLRNTLDEMTFNQPATSQSRYEVRGSSLRENSKTDKGFTQIRCEEYQRIANAAAEACKKHPSGFTAQQVAEEREGKGAKPNTHVYLCIRFWVANKIVKKLGGGLFVPCGSAPDFRKATDAAWELAAARET